LPNIFKLMKLARTAYKAAPVVIPIGLAVAKYAKSKLEKRAIARAGGSPILRDEGRHIDGEYHEVDRPLGRL